MAIRAEASPQQETAVSTAPEIAAWGIGQREFLADVLEEAHVLHRVSAASECPEQNVDEIEGFAPSQASDPLQFHRSVSLAL